jgi:hypothetical protein
MPRFRTGLKCPAMATFGYLVGEFDVLRASRVDDLRKAHGVAEYLRHEHDLPDVAAAFNMAMRCRGFRE